MCSWSMINSVPRLDALVLGKQRDASSTQLEAYTRTRGRTHVISGTKFAKLVFAGMGG